MPHEQLPNSEQNTITVQLARLGVAGALVLVVLAALHRGGYLGGEQPRVRTETPKFVVAKGGGPSQNSAPTNPTRRTAADDLVYQAPVSEQKGKDEWPSQSKVAKVAATPAKQTAQQVSHQVPTRPKKKQEVIRLPATAPKAARTLAQRPANRPVSFWQGEPETRPDIAEELPALPAGIPSVLVQPSLGPVSPPVGLAPGQFEVPLQTAGPLPGDVRSNGNLVSVSVRDAPLHAVLSLIAEQQGISIVASSSLQMQVTVTLQPTPLENALDAILAVCNCTWTRQNNVIYVTSVKQGTIEAFGVQGREMRLFELNYVASTDVEKVVTGLLSPVGKTFSRQVDSKEKRKAIEQVVVEDLPPYVARIAEYIAQADQPPRQVMVEARLLQVKLENDFRHGVNLESLGRISGTNIKLATQAFTAGAGPAAVFTVDGTDFDSLIDCLAATNDTKTLANPKVLMINGQEAKIQIGRRLGFFVSTTTQTSTVQDVQFLEVGVVLSVTPQITVDGQIMMKVKPKVSSGDINPTTTLPEEETTELETSILVPDGHGVIIGGLIQELDTDRQAKVPILGDLWAIGWLFQCRVVERERSEVVVALLPRIVPNFACVSPQEEVELQRVAAPIVTPQLQSAPRPWEAELPNANQRPAWLGK